MEFLNEQIDVKGLPDITDIQAEKLAANYLKVIFITRGLTSFIFITGIVVAAILLKDISVTIRFSVAGLLIILFIWFFSLSSKVFNTRSYAIRQRDIIYTRGLLFKSTTIVPFNRIQHAEIVSGPIDRFYNLSSLKIFTAGGSQSDLSLPGLLSSDAARIKSFIISKTAQDEEE
ncbi:MAG TPA: PH domain-containing protein [Saprospiraceae bacterium]|nr:PH domain-containing protein [Saprospiraceae bacterium]